jgi:hypothetical protein
MDIAIARVEAIQLTFPAVPTKVQSSSPIIWSIQPHTSFYALKGANLVKISQFNCESNVLYNTLHIFSYHPSIKDRPYIED